MARGGTLNLAAAVVSNLCLLGITAALGLRLGPAGVGIYWQAYALLSLLGLLSLGGFGTAMTRYIAVHRADGDPGAVRGTVRTGLALTLSLSTAAGASLWFGAPWLARVGFEEPTLVDLLRLAALTLPALALLDASLGATKGFKTMRPYALIGFVVEPLLRLGLTVAAVLAGGGARGAMAALLASTCVGAALAAASLRRLLGAPGAPPVYRPRELFGFSMFSWLAAVASTGLTWADTILLGVFLPSSQVGVYNVATRLVVLASFVMMPINSAFAPRIADLHHRGRTEALRRAYAAATGWIVRLSLPAFIVLGLFATEVLRLFGAEFAVGAVVTVTLAAGKLVDAGTGPCALMLNMSGRPALNMADNIAVLVLNVALNLWLIPRFGIVGSAAAWAAALALVNLLRVLQVRATMGMLPFGAGLGPAVGAGAAALLAGAAVRALAPGELVLPAGVAAVAVTYVAVTLAIGLSAEDRLVIASLRSGRRPLSRGAPGT
jgi:O-antigen/teichoic acid export membrane protein